MRRRFFSRSRIRFSRGRRRVSRALRRSKMIFAPRGGFRF